MEQEQIMPIQNAIDSYAYANKHISSLLHLNFIDQMILSDDNFLPKLTCFDTLLL